MKMSIAIQATNKYEGAHRISESDEEEILWCETCGERAATEHLDYVSLCSDCAIATKQEIENEYGRLT
jgi:Zn finger protein HypA/HybF involved in hydrogenase expression